MPDPIVKKSRIENLLEQILFRLEVLTTKELIPQIDKKKNLSFLYDLVNLRWTSFRPIQLNNMRLFGCYYNSAPTQLSAIEEGWNPLTTTSKSELKVSNADLLAKNIELKTVLDAIQGQTDKLTFTGNDLNVKTA